MAYTRLAYDPWEISPEERQATFVGREALLHRLLSAVAEQQGHHTIQHYLILGPRGIGKTTILLTVRDRLRSDPGLFDQWFCVQLREEEYYVRTLRDLLDLTLQALAENENVSEAAELARRIHDERDEERSLAMAMDGLRAISGSHHKRILLLVDNFDRLFPATARGHGKTRSPQNEYRAFRKLLSTESFLMVIGASVRLFQEIAAYDQAFFNFFCPVEIPNLNDDEIQDLLRKRAEADANPGFARKLESIKDQVRAITWMTGGNPRLVMMLYDVLNQHELIHIVQALRETVGSLTPMLKHVLDDMPRQQSKTLDALIRLGGVASPSEVSSLARLRLNVVTAQLGRLRDERFVTVEGEGKGRPASYRIADPMFRTWYQIRYLRPAGRRIELFVEFLRAWFSVEERQRFLKERWASLQNPAGQNRLSGLSEACLGIEYYAASLEDEQERRLHFDRLADTMFKSGRMREAARLLAEGVSPRPASPARFESLGYGELGRRLLVIGEPQKAIESFSSALKKDPKNIEARIGLGLAFGRFGDHASARSEFDKVIGILNAPMNTLVRALFNRGVCKGMLGDTPGAIADYTAVAELPGAPADHVAKALFNRGVRKGLLGDTPGEIADYTAVAELSGAPADHMAKAIFNRGVRKGLLGDTPGAIADYNAVAELPGAPADQVAQALVNRGVCKGLLGDTPGAIADYTAVAELPGVPAEQVANAFFNRGVRTGLTGDTPGAIADYTAVAEVPGAPADQVANALVNRGVSKGLLGDTPGAIADYNAVAELPGAPADQVATALFNRGVSKGLLGDTPGAIADYTAVAELPGAPAEQVANALVNRGVSKGLLGDTPGAIADYNAVAGLHGAPAEQVATALVNRGVCKGLLGDTPGEIADYTAVAELPGAPVEQVAKALFNRGVCRGMIGDTPGAIADYNAVAGLSGAPAEQVANAIVNRGVCKGLLGDTPGENADYTAVAELPGAPADHMAKALFNRGVSKGMLGDTTGEIADYNAAADLPGAPADLVAKALFNRGVCKGMLGDTPGAIADFTATAELPGAPADHVAKALVNRGALHGESGDNTRALSDFEAALNIKGGSQEQRLAVLLRRGQALNCLHRTEEACRDWAECAEAGESVESVHKAVACLVGAHLKQDRRDEAFGWAARLGQLEKDKIPLDQQLEFRMRLVFYAGNATSLGAAEALLDALLANDKDEIRERIKFLKPAIEFARSDDERILAPLPQEEQKAARQIATVLKGKPDA